MSKVHLSCVVRGLKGKVLHADSWEVIYNDCTKGQAEAEAMIQLGKRLVKQGTLNKKTIEEIGE